MNSKSLLYASAVGAAAVAYIAILILHFDVLSIYTVFYAILGALVGVAVAYRIRFR
jgi:hypothetical protein